MRRKPESLRTYGPKYRYQNKHKSGADNEVTYSIFYESLILRERVKGKN